MKGITHWTLLALVGLTMLFAGCASNDDDDDDNGGVSISGGGNDNNNDDNNGGGTASGEARGSPGWGFLGTIAVVLGLGILVRRT